MPCALTFSRSATQAVARRVYEEGWSGLHWWSALTGDWHTTVLFLDPLRVGPGELSFGAPEVLTVAHPAVVRCTVLLGIERGRGAERDRNRKGRAR